MNWRRIYIVIVFCVLLSIPFWIGWFSSDGGDHMDQNAAMKRYGFYLEEVSKRSGVDFVHQAPSLDPKLDNIMPQIAAMGAGVSVVDFDRDGWSDIYLTNSHTGSLNALYRNNHDGTFTDVAGDVGVADVNKEGTGVSMGAVWGDYDNDGWEDLLVYKWGKTALYKNNEGKSFTKVDTAGFPEWANINTGIWFDYDRDGKLDIFLGAYFRPDINLWKLKDTKIMPDSFEYANNGGRNYLFHNLGNGKFEEVSEQMGLRSTRWALAAGAADLTGNGYPDLFVSNDYGVSELFLNDGGKRFVDASESSGIGFAPKSGMNASFGDVLSDGRLAIYESNISERGILLQGNNLWIPREGSKGGDIKFDNLANAVGVEDGGWSWGSQFGDFDNDGDMDIFLTNGYVSADKNSNYWYDFSKVTMGNKSIIGDARNWPAMKGRSLSGYQQKKLWLNDGKGSFSNAALSVGVRETFDGRAVAIADLWNTGALDVIVANQRGPALIYKNHVAKDRNWIEFEFPGQDAIGTRVTLFQAGRRLAQEIQGGSGYCAQNQRRVHFGLGDGGKVEKVEIRSPDGTVKTIENPEVNEIHKIKS